MRSILRAQKNEVEENCTKGIARLQFSGTRAAERRRSSYRLLSAGSAFQLISNSNSHFKSFGMFDKFVVNVDKILLPTFVSCKYIRFHPFFAFIL